MVKFRKDSWHARLCTKIYGPRYLDRQRSLCRHFWGTVAAVIVGGIAYAVYALALPGIWLFHRIPVGAQLSDRDNVAFRNGCLACGVLCLGYALIFVAFAPLVGLRVPPFVVWLFLDVMIVSIGFGTLATVSIAQRSRSQRAPTEPPRQPGLLKTYLAAVKQRVCPVIDWQE